MAIGDSLTSATAANSAALWEVLVENRGLSWCIGGQGNFRTHLTLPNILKEFNPKLFGSVYILCHKSHKGSFCFCFCICLILAYFRLIFENILYTFEIVYFGYTY